MKRFKPPMSPKLMWKRTGVVHETSYILCQCGREFFRSGKTETIVQAIERWRRHRCKP